MKKALLCVSICLAAFTSYAGPRIKILSWNVQSGGNNSTTIAQTLSDFEGFDIIGLSEVNQANAATYATALEAGEGAGDNATANFDHVLGTTGGGDRLVIVWDAKRFNQVGNTIELTAMATGGHRAPLAVRLSRIGGTEEFIFMVNHLARVNFALRQTQAQDLVNWATQQTVPVINVGDFNFDYSIDGATGNPAFAIFMANATWEWIRPEELYQTQLSPRFHSVLDFVFVSGRPQNWTMNSKILHLDQLTDSASDSDHRPIQCIVRIE